MDGREQGRRHRSVRQIRGTAAWALLLAAAVPAICGCATVGRTFPAEQVDRIHLGETTKGQLLSMFGVPYRRGVEDGDSTWTYLHYKYRMFGEHLKSRDLFVRFTDDGRVRSYTYSSNMEP